MGNQDSTKEEEISKKFTSLLIDIDAVDLTRFEDDGPYLCGRQFTLADIHIFGFIERTIIALQHYKRKKENYRSWKITITDTDTDNDTATATDNTDTTAENEERTELTNIRRWYQTMLKRPSI